MGRAGRDRRPGRRWDAGVWPLRVVWALLPLIAGPLLSGSAISGLLDDRSRPVGWVAGVLAGLGWAAGVVAVLAPHPLGLTAMRVLAPAALGVAVLAVPFGDAGAAAEVAALALGVICLSAVVAGSTIDAFVDGASYGAERRWGLRIPANLLLGPVPLAWLVIVGAAAGGPLLLAAGQWLA